MTTTGAPFQVECPACRQTFPVAPSKVPEGGIPAICDHCWRVFPVEPPEAATSEQAAMPAPSASEPTRAASWPSGDAGADEEGPATEEADPPGGERSDAGASVLESTEPGAETPHPAQRVPEAPEPRAAQDWSPFEDLTAVTREAAGEPEEGGSTPGGPATDVEGATDTADTGSSPFGRRDPHDRARRLARVLVSDMITYHPERHARALEEGTLEEDFEDEVQKSWEEYVDQVGAEIAQETRYFQEALNEILARGENLY